MASAYTLILTSISSEFNAIKPLIKVRKEIQYLGRVLLIGRYKHNHLPVILTMMGVGPINATLTTQALLIKYCIKQVVNVGIAGGVSESLNIGDIVIPTQTGLYQQQVYAREVAPGVYEPPPFLQGVEYGNFEFIFPQATEVLDGTITPDPPIDMFTPTSRRLFKIATCALKDVTLKQCAEVDGISVCVEHPPKFQFGGTVVSGPTFVDNAKFREWLIANPKFNTPEMPLAALDEETAAINFVCRQNKIPMVAIRALSDLAGGRSGPNELVAFLPVSLANLQLVTNQILQHLGCACHRK